MKVFLGGTVNDSQWRNVIMPQLDIEYFNPVVEDWDDAAWEREIHERKYCDYVLYVLTPKMVGYYSIAEVTDDSFRRPDRTIFCCMPVDGDKVFTEAELETFEKIGDKVEKNGGKWLKSLDEIVSFLNSAKNNEKETKALNLELYDAFISYGRNNSKNFAHKLSNNLIDKGLKVWFDHNSVPLNVDFQEDIFGGIRRSNNFIYIISPHSIKSEYCRKELLMAVELKKRIIPVLHIEPAESWANEFPALTTLNKILFQEEVYDFDKSFIYLLQVLDNQKEYVQKHTIWLNKAIEWQKSQRNESKLLVGEERFDAETWFHTDFKETLAPCFPTDLMCEFIWESKELADNSQTEMLVINDADDTELAEKIRIEFLRKGITCWTSQSDLKSDSDIQAITNTAIEKAASVVLIVSEKSLQNKNCLCDLQFAFKLNKRIIPIQIDEIDEHRLPPSIKTIQSINYVERTKSNYDELVKKILNAYNRDLDYYKTQRDILVKALEWYRKSQVSNLLLYGFDLEKAKQWLKNSKERKLHLPLSLQHKYIADSERTRPSAFISYGRRHSAVFAAKLHDRLNNEGFNVWFDKNDIPLGVDFQQQIDSGIENSDNFIFIISPHSVKSIYCQKEVILAIKLNKRIIPILHISPDDCWEQLNPVIGKLNWIYCREKEDFTIPLNQWEQLDNFDTAYKGLATLMHQHEDYVKLHKEILISALEWDRNQRKTQFLLFGHKRLEAEKWLATDFNKEQPPCLPTDLQSEYISDSKKNANNGYTEVFLSYATENKAIRERIDRALARNGITTWLNSKDIKKGMDFERSLREGVEQADNLLYFISPQAVASEYCKQELEYALELNKRIVSILIEPTDLKTVHPYVRGLQFINFIGVSELEPVVEESIDISKLSVTQRAELDVNTRKDKTLWETRVDELVQNIRRNHNYFELHKQFLVLALKWKNLNNNPSFLLRGNDLQNALAWLKIAGTRQDNLPTELQKEFINESQAHVGLHITEVFLSYTQADLDFTRRIYNQLQITGKTTRFDQECDTSSSEERTAILKSIETASNFVFVISPDTVKSEFCLEELEQAKLSNKRIIAIQSTDIPVNELPASIATLTAVDFTQADFSAAYAELIKKIDTDHDYVEQHTRMAQRAGEWKEKNRIPDLLLRSAEYKEANEWLQNAQKEKKIPQPSELQKEFIELSNQALLAALAKERQRKLIQRLMIAIIVACFAIIGFGYYGIDQHKKVVQLTQVIVQKEKIIKEKGNTDSLNTIIKKLRKQMQQFSNVATTGKTIKNDVDNEFQSLQIVLAKEYSAFGDSILMVASRLGFLKMEQKRLLVKQAKIMFEKSVRFGNKDGQKGLDRIINNKEFAKCLESK